MLSCSNEVFVKSLTNIVGQRHVITSKKKMARYCRGYRSGGGEAIAVIRPGSLIEQWQVLELCVKNKKL